MALTQRLIDVAPGLDAAPRLRPRVVDPADDPALEQWTAEQIRLVGREVIELMADQLAGSPDRPVYRQVPAELARKLASGSLPDDGIEPAQLLEAFRDEIAPYPLGNNHGRFWAWVCSPANVMAVFGDALASAMNPHCDVANHAAVHLERQVLDWFREMVGFPTASGGVLVSGGSMANLTGLATARHARSGWDDRENGLAGGPRLRVYVSDQGHSCIRKAIELLGIGSANLRIVPTDDRFRMRIRALESMIAEDRKAGYRPLAVVGSAGSTNTGSIDPLERIAEICRREDLWFHVDGAYGAPAIMTDRYRDALAGLALADSVAVDPHKWLQIPVEAGVALVRDQSLLRDTFSLVPSYLRTDGGEDGVEGPISFAQLGFQQTRGFRALKIWFGLRNLGKRRIVRLINQNCQLAERLHVAVVNAPDLESLAPQSLSVVCFRAAPPSLRGDDVALDALNRSIVERIQLGGAFFVAKTVVRGRTGIRVCIVNGGARPSDVAALVRLIRAEAGRLIGEDETRLDPPPAIGVAPMVRYPARRPTTRVAIKAVWRAIPAPDPR
jgi:aromatic-L-amino-acid decarboxylase